MKELLLIRHAKSSWKHPELSDHDRPLNKRGKSDLPRMLRRLMDRKLSLDECWSSTAVRAKTTAVELAPAVCSFEVKLKEELYTFDPSELAKEISRADPLLNSLAIVGHNPAMEMLIDELLTAEDTTPETHHFPTCAMAMLKLDIENWSDIHSGCASLVFFDWPKRLED